jgi:glycosyltransferase involved in cell wall biosynthesis
MLGRRRAGVRNVPAGNLKIVYVLTRMIVGGAQETGKHTAEHFERRGDRVLLVTGPETGREGVLRADVPTLVLSELVRSISPRDDLRALWRLYRLFKEEKPDIVHCATAKARVLAPLAARLAGVRIVVQTIHGYSFNNEIDRYRSLYVAVEALGARLCHCNVVVSEADREEGLRLRILRPSTTALIRPGVDSARIADVDERNVERIRDRYAPDGERLVLLVGRLSSPKTPEVFVEAAALLLREHDRARFLLVGDGAKREALRSQIERLGLSDGVQLLGLRDDVPDLLAASHILVHSSTHEGLPKTVLEGMAAGKPVVATAVGGVPSAVKDGVTGLLVESSNPRALAAAVGRLLADEALGSELAARAGRNMSEFSRERTLQDTEALYQRLTQARAPR